MHPSKTFETLQDGFDDSFDNVLHPQLESLTFIIIYEINILRIENFFQMCIQGHVMLTSDSSKVKLSSKNRESCKITLPVSHCLRRHRTSFRLCYKW